MLSLIFTLSFFFFAALSMVFGMLAARKYKWQMATSKIIINVAAILLSVLLTALVSWGVLSLGKLTLGGLLDDSVSLSAIEDIVIAIGSAAIAPLFFIGIFFVVRRILNCFRIPLAALLLKIGLKKRGEEESHEVNEEGIKPRKLKKLKKLAPFKSKNKFDPIGAPLGALCGFIVYFAVLIPIVGVISFGNSVLGVVNAFSKEPMPALVQVVEISDGVGFKTVRALGGELAYRGMTTCSVDGRLVSAAADRKLLEGIAEAKLITKNQEIPREEAAEAVRERSDDVKKAKFLPIVASKVLSDACGSWNDGGEFLGVSLPKISETIDPFVKDVVFVMKDSTFDTARTDSVTVVNIVAYGVENKAFGAGAKGALKNDIFMEKTILELLNNEHLSPLVTSVTSLAINVFTDEMNVIENDEANYNTFVADVSSAYGEAMAIADYSERINGLAEKLDDIYDAAGIEVSEGVARCIAISMIDSMKSGSESDVKEFFAPKNDSVQLLSTSNERGSALDLMDNIGSRIKANTDRDALLVIVKEELFRVGTVSENLAPEVCQALAEEIADELYTSVKKDKLTYKKALFANAEELGKKSIAVTRDELSIKGGEITDKEKESKALAKIFKEFLTLVERSGSLGENGAEGLISDLGGVLDAFSDSQTIGNEKTALILSAMLQSESIRSNVGMSLVGMSNMADSINEGKTKGESYTTLMKTFGKTVEIMRVTSDEGDSTEQINELMKELTPTSAETLQQISTPELVKKNGVPQKSAEPVSDMLSDMFGNMSTAKEQGMSDEQYEKEAVAVNDMMKIAMSATKSQERSTFGENSATGISATEFVNRATDSQVISNTLVNSVYEEESDPKMDPLASDKKLSEAEKTELVGALDAKWKTQLATSSDEAANAEYQKTLISIAAVLNVNVSVSGNSIIAA